MVAVEVPDVEVIRGLEGSLLSGLRRCPATGLQIGRNVYVATTDFDWPFPGAESLLLECNCVISRRNGNRRRCISNERSIDFDVGSSPSGGDCDFCIITGPRFGGVLCGVRWAG